jgi:hypothetical protein
LIQGSPGCEGITGYVRPFALVSHERMLCYIEGLRFAGQEKRDD